MIIRGSKASSLTSSDVSRRFLGVGNDPESPLGSRRYNTRLDDAVDGLHQVAA